MRVFAETAVSLISTDVPGSTYAEYNSATLYGVDYQVKVSFEADGVTPLGSVEEYKSIDANNQDNYPPDSPDKWTPLGVSDGGNYLAVSNRYAALDGYVNTQTIQKGGMEYTLDVGGSNCVGLFNVQAKTIDFELTAMGEVRARKSDFSLVIYPEGDWWSYFNSDLEWKRETIWSYPRWSEATLKVNLAYYSGADAKCGMIVCGKEKNIGTMLYGGRFGMRDYSRPNPDSIGRVSLVPDSNFSKTRYVEVRILNDQVDLVEQRLLDLRGTACIWDCNNPGSSLRSLVLYGYYKDFYITMKGCLYSTCIIEVEGLI